MRHLRLHVTSDPANLAPVRRAVEAFCDGCGFDSKSTGDVGLCVNEALANITRHAYAGAHDRPVHVEGQFSDGVLTIEIRDWGNGRIPPPPPAVHDPLTPGGLGLVCLVKLLDDVRYVPQPDGMKLVMKKKAVGSR